MKPTITSWDGLVEAFKLEYLPPHLDFVTWEKIRSYKQSLSQKCSVFIATMENLFSRLHSVPSESVRLEQIMYNLHPYYLERLALQEVTSLAQLSQLCSKLEDMKQRMLSSNPKSSARFSVSEVPAYSVNSLSCWNCHQEGHFFYQCSQPARRFCHGCGKPNIVKSACSKCATKNEGMATSLAVAASNSRPETSSPESSRKGKQPVKGGSYQKKSGAKRH